MDRSIIFFDDVCVLCSKSVQLIIRNDPRGRFQFAAIGSERCLQLLNEHDYQGQEVPDSIILYHKNKIYTRSAAALQIASKLRFPWSVFVIFYIIPGFIRDPIYDLIARKRYHWFGKRERCFVPGEGDRWRFLSSSL